MVPIGYQYVSTSKQFFGRPVIRLFLLILAVISGAASIFMFVNRPDQPVAEADISLVEPLVVEAPAENVPKPLETDAEPADVSESQLEILVASVDIAKGARLSRADTEWVLIDDEGAPSGAFNREDHPNADSLIIGRVSVRDLLQGDPILAADLTEAEQRSLSMILEPGERAISLNVSEDIIAGGFILPGDRVDILHVRPIEGGAVDSRVLAQNVEVIALDQNMSDEITGSTYVSRTATIVVDVNELATISAAIEAPGRLSLALRSLSEQDDFQIKKAPVDANEEAQSTIRVIRNGVLETVTVRQ